MTNPKEQLNFNSKLSFIRDLVSRSLSRYNKLDITRFAASSFAFEFWRTFFKLYQSNNQYLFNIYYVRHRTQVP